MTSTDYPPRLAVLAAIMGGEHADADGDTAESLLAREARLGGDIFSKAQPAMAAEPTPMERALAEALHDDNRNGWAPADNAIAELLLLADDVPAASDLANGLMQAYLLPNESRSGAAKEERCPAFADLYRKLALHQLNNQVRNKASAILSALIRRGQVGPTRSIAAR